MRKRQVKKNMLTGRQHPKIKKKGLTHLWKFTEQDCKDILSSGELGSYSGCRLISG